MARKIDQVRARVLTTFPSWRNWSSQQKALIILRNSHGRIPVDEFGMTDAMHPTIVEYATSLGMNSIHFEYLLRDKDVLKALRYFDKHNAYPRGKRKNGNSMKRATLPEELMLVYAYDNAPSNLFKVSFGLRRSLSQVESEQIGLWLADADETATIKYVDSAKAREEGLAKGIDYETGLPMFEEEGLKPFVRDIDPVTGETIEPTE